MIIKKSDPDPTAARRALTIWTVAPLLVAVVAVVLMLVQRAEVGALRAEVAAASRTTPQPVEAEAAPTRPPTAEDPVTVAKSVAATDVPPGAEATLAAFESRLAAVESRLSGLEEVRLTAMSRRGPRAPAGEVVDEVSALREDVDALLTGEGIESEEGRAAIQKLVDQANQKRREKWMSVRDQAAEDWVTEVAGALNLDEARRGEMADILKSRRDQRRALFRKVRDEELTYTQARTEMDKVGEVVRDKLVDLLGHKDFEVFEQKWDERSRGGRRGSL